MRFEDQIKIDLFCCNGRPMLLRGNMSLRGTSGKNTTLAYECGKCSRRVAVVDEWPEPGASVFENDSVE